MEDLCPGSPDQVSLALGFERRAPVASRRGPPPENLLVKRRRSRPGSGFNLTTMGTVLISIQRQTRIKTLPNHVFALTLTLG